MVLTGRPAYHMHNGTDIGLTRYLIFITLMLLRILFSIGFIASESHKSPEILTGMIELWSVIVLWSKYTLRLEAAAVKITQKCKGNRARVTRKSNA